MLSLSSLKKFPTGPALILVAATLWAFDGVLRRSLYSLPPLTIVFFEHLIGAALLVPVAWRSLSQLKLTKKIVGLTLTVSLLSSLLGTLWFTTALLKVNFIAFSVVFLLQKLQPLFAITSARLLLKEELNRQYLGWAALALVAAYFVTFPTGSVNLATGAGTVIAALFAVGAAAAWGTGTTLSKLLLKEVSDQQATALRFMTTTVLGLVALVLTGLLPTLTTPTPIQLGTFVVIALSTGMVALYIYYKGLKQTQAKISTILELVFPLLAVVIDGVVYKSYLAPTQWLAAAMLLFAMYRVGMLQRKTSA